jgi:hypothetical protein
MYSPHTSQRSIHPMWSKCIHLYISIRGPDEADWRKRHADVTHRSNSVRLFHTSTPSVLRRSWRLCKWTRSLRAADALPLCAAHHAQALVPYRPTRPPPHARSEQPRPGPQATSKPTPTRACTCSLTELHSACKRCTLKVVCVPWSQTLVSAPAG